MTTRDRLGRVSRLGGADAGVNDGAGQENAAEVGQGVFDAPMDVKRLSLAGGESRWGDVAVDLAGDVALEAADGLAAGLALGDAAFRRSPGCVCPSAGGRW